MALNVNPLLFINLKNPLENASYQCEKCEANIPDHWNDGGPYECSKLEVCFVCYEEFMEGFWGQKKDQEND